MNPYLKNNKRFSRSTSFIFCIVAYIIAIAIAFFVQKQFAYLGDIYSVLIADVIATIVIYIFGLFVSNASLYDPYWSVAPVPIAIYWWSLSNFDLSLNKILLLIVLLYWAVRLTLNWARGWSGLEHEDWRYGMLRQKNGKLYQFVNLSGIHLFPTILVFLGMLPVYYVLAFNYEAQTMYSISAFIIGIIAVSISLIADEQLKKFVKENKVRGVFLRSGLWQYSRHPNYFGEVSFWFSTWLFALSVNSDYLWTGIGVLAMFLLFWFISIPMMDERMSKRKIGYKDFMKTTSRFFLLPRR